MRWERNANKINLREVNYDVVADPKTPISQAVKAANNDAIIMSFPIAAFGKEKDAKAKPAKEEEVKGGDDEESKDEDSDVDAAKNGGAKETAAAKPAPADKGGAAPDAAKQDTSKQDATKQDTSKDAAKAKDQAAAGKTPAKRPVEKAYKETGKEPSIIIDVTRLFTSDVFEFSARQRLNATMMDASRSYVERISPYPENIEVEATHTYHATPTPAGLGDRRNRAPV